ncbi:energy transducer TonB [Methylosinus sp. H3A]|uniref:energy transducer TonB n=1 Tax=Methylosinus sp. H3A TaxID=2785786 RepID=UPI0018C1E62B|nr:energy transducer TonB [Methylosinus sp. H3A]MBG0809277.1 energy transducer TonB [Methylosinus sp. H3A]
MTAAAAEALIGAQETIATAGEFRNTQSLLLPDGGRPNYPVRAAAVLAYALLLTAAVNFSLPHTETPAEEPLELVVVPNPAVDQPPPEEIPQPEELDDTPPPPEAIEPVAPIEPPKPPAPKPVPKVVEKNPTPRPAAAARTDAAPAQSASTNANAQQSIAANQFLSCMQRSARNAAPDSPIPKHGRVAYRATFSANGGMTGFSIVSSSGNPTLDAIATRVGSRCGSLPAIGRLFTVSGGVVF